MWTVVWNITGEIIQKTKSSVIEIMKSKVYFLKMKFSYLYIKWIKSVKTNEYKFQFF